MIPRDCDGGLSARVHVNPFHAHDCECGQCEPAQETEDDLPDYHPDDRIVIVEEDYDCPARIARDLSALIARWMAIRSEDCGGILKWMQVNRHLCEAEKAMLRE